MRTKPHRLTRRSRGAPVGILLSYTAVTRQCAELGRPSVSTELQRARERYSACREESYTLAASSLERQAGLEFRLTGWRYATREAYREQWVPCDRHPDGDFNWDEIFRRHRDPNRLDIAIWAGTEKKRLSALGLGLCTGESVLLRFLEGDPRSDCPLKKVRALIALEVASTYAQLMGRRELRV